MDKKFENEIQQNLIRALEDAKAYGQKMRDKEEQRLWKNVKNIPCTLSEAVNSLTKNEMDTIRKKLELNNVSSLKKAEMGTVLVKQIPLKAERIIYTLDEERYQLFKRMTNNSGFIIEPNISSSKAEALMDYGLSFPSIYNNKKVLVIPIEIMSVFLNADGSKLQKIVDRNTEWIKLTKGMLYYYGVADILVLKENIERLTENEFDLLEYLKVISKATDYYEQISYADCGFADDRVFDTQKVYNEQLMRFGEDEYCRFTKQQLLNASEPDYVDRTQAMDNFLNFLTEHYELTTQDTHEIAYQLVNMINMDAKPSMIIDYIQSWFEFPSIKFAELFSQKLMELSNNTRLWVLKGYTPSEMRPDAKADSNIIDFKTKTKVGRNDPCPCGSGKKFKKCCGR